MVFATHWHESAMDLHVFPIPIPPPASLRVPFLCIFPVHQPWALVSCMNLKFSDSTFPLLVPISRSMSQQSLQKSHLLCFLQQQSPGAPPTPCGRTSAFLLLVVLADTLPAVHHIPCRNASLSFSEHSYPVCQSCRGPHTQDIVRPECLPSTGRLCCYLHCGQYHSCLDYCSVSWASSHFGPWLSIVCFLLRGESKPLNIHFPSFHSSAQNSALVSTFHSH